MTEAPLPFSALAIARTSDGADVQMRLMRQPDGSLCTEPLPQDCVITEVLYAGRRLPLQVYDTAGVHVATIPERTC